MLPNIEVQKLQEQHFVENVDELEEALSFSDLPITKIIGSNGKCEGKQDEDGMNGDDFDFDFGSLVGSIDQLESEMCSADEVFSGGQLLPFRHSVSSEVGLSRFRNSSWPSVSRSESMDRLGLCSRSTSSRSSSIRSQYSTTSSSTSTTSSSHSAKTIPIPKIKGRNTFHSHPSPKPHVWTSGAGVRGSGPTTNNWSNPMSKKSTMWDVLRLGLVRAPEIELQDLKQRPRFSTSSVTTFTMPRNNSSTSTTTSSNDGKKPKGNKINNDLSTELHMKKSKGGFFKSCKCSVLAIEPIPLPTTTREFCTYTNNNKSDGHAKNSKWSTNYHVLKDDNELAQQKEEQQKMQDNRQGRPKVTSHHNRTFEWLRDLSHANVLNS